MANSVYLFFTALSFGLAVFLKNNFNASDMTGLILSAIGLYFLVVFLYVTFKADTGYTLNGAVDIIIEPYRADSVEYDYNSGKS